VPGRIGTCRCGYEASSASSVQPDASGVEYRPKANVHVWVLIVIALAAAGVPVYYLSQPSGTTLDVERAGNAPALPAIGSGERIQTADTQPESAAIGAPPPRMVPIEPVTPALTPAASAANTAGSTIRSIEEIVSRAAAAVVLISTSTATGTGFFVTQDLLLTNAHVVEGHSVVTVKLASGQMLQGRVERTSVDLDLAVVRAAARPESNQILQLGSAIAVRPGQEVLAIGSPLGLQNTVTRGIVSAVRNLGGVELIQTDAAINPGNSGGPLLDRDGRVIGVTTLKVTRGAESLGFAVAIAHAVPLIEGRAIPSGAGTVQAPSLQVGSRETEMDVARTGGAMRFEQAMQAAAQRADQIDQQWKRFQANCVAGGFTGDGQREWFSARDQAPAYKTPHSGCTAFAGDLQVYVRELSDFMIQAADQARRAGVYPGTLRDIRRKYRIDWSGWER
jgi:S1-C subfamily serine protease